MTRLDLMATQPHYVDHLIPIWARLHEQERGTFWVLPGPTAERLAGYGHSGEWLMASREHTNPVLVAGYGDLKRSRLHKSPRKALMQHGVGQSYGNDSPAFPGGRDNRDVSLFLTPNEYSASRWAARYPAATVVTVGSPYVERVLARDKMIVPRDGSKVVVLSFHWNCSLFPETRPAWAHYRKTILEDLRQQGWRVLGHAHPRARAHMERWYDKHDIEFITTFPQVALLADLFIADNTSALFEFAATGRPVVVLNAPWYRRQVNHGGRFWDWATVGLNVNEPGELVQAVACALVDPPGVREERQRIVRLVHGEVHGSTDRAVNTLRAWLHDG